MNNDLNAIELLLEEAPKLNGAQFKTSIVIPQYGDVVVDYDTIVQASGVLKDVWDGAHDFVRDELTFANGVFRDVTGTIIGTIADVLEIATECVAKLLHVATEAACELLGGVVGIFNKNPLFLIAVVVGGVFLVKVLTKKRESVSAAPSVGRDSNLRVAENPAKLG